MKKMTPHTGREAMVLNSLRHYLAAGTILTLIYAVLHSGFTAGSIKNALFIWGDALSMSAVILFLAVGVSALDRNGVIDWASYALFLSRFLLMKKEDKEFVNYSDYKALKDRSRVPYWPGLSVALIFFLTGFILTMFYYQF